MKHASDASVGTGTRSSAHPVVSAMSGIVKSAGSASTQSVPTGTICAGSGAPRTVENVALVVTNRSTPAFETAFVSEIVALVDAGGLYPATSILGLPVDTTLTVPGASAVIYGGMEAKGIGFDGVAEALSVPETDLRLFGKPESFTRRRMGVAVSTAADAPTARARAREAASKVRPVG